MNPASSIHRISLLDWSDMSPYTPRMAKKPKRLRGAFAQAKFIVDIVTGQIEAADDEYHDRFVVDLATGQIASEKTPRANPPALTRAFFRPKD
jgi:hypothetical protein